MSTSLGDSNRIIKVKVIMSFSRSRTKIIEALPAKWVTLLSNNKNSVSLYPNLSFHKQPSAQFLVY